LSKEPSVLKLPKQLPSDWFMCVKVWSCFEVKQQARRKLTLSDWASRDLRLLVTFLSSSSNSPHLLREQGNILTCYLSNLVPSWNFSFIHWIFAYSSAISALSSALSSSPSRITSLRATCYRKEGKIIAEQKQRQRGIYLKKGKNSWSLRLYLLIFAVGLLCNVFGFFELHLLDLHLLLVFHGSVLNHLHASKDEEDTQPLAQRDFTASMSLKWYHKYKTCIS